MLNLSSHGGVFCCHTQFPRNIFDTVWQWDRIKYNSRGSLELFYRCGVYGAWTLCDTFMIRAELRLWSREWNKVRQGCGVVSKPFSLWHIQHRLGIVVTRLYEHRIHSAFQDWERYLETRNPDQRGNQIMAWDYFDNRFIWIWDKSHFINWYLKFYLGSKQNPR